MAWTEEKVKKLKELWGKGSTASQIAEIIGDMSRNAVIIMKNNEVESASICTFSESVNPIISISDNIIKVPAAIAFVQI